MVSLVTLQKDILKSLPQSVQGSLLVGYWFCWAQNALYYIKCLNLINYTWQQPAQADFLVLVHFFLQKHIENQRTITLNDKFNPLQLSQLKNLLDPGLI